MAVHSQATAIFPLFGMKPPPQRLRQLAEVADEARHIRR
jgi:hypothetical protein